LNALEFAIATTPPDALGNIQITLEVAQESIQQRAIQYDKNVDAHYETISAFIKSVRGSAPDAALFWLAKMMEAGEDPKFILRRLMVLAGEDIGLADPQALVIATSASTAFERLGLPEGLFPIIEATLYLATAPKSNSALAYFKAVETIKAAGVGDVPLHLMDSNRDAKSMGHGKGYKYPHEYPNHYIDQQYLPEEFKNLKFYEPSAEGYEKQIRERLEQLQTKPDSDSQPS
jgi:putative ATPase